MGQRGKIRVKKVSYSQKRELHKCTLLSPIHFLDRGHRSGRELPRKEENISSDKGHSIY